MIESHVNQMPEDKKGQDTKQRKEAGKKCFVQFTFDSSPG